MPEYAYRAKKGPREIVDGTIQAATQEEAIDKLGELGLLPIRIEEAGSDKKEAQAATTSQSPIPTSKPEAHPPKGKSLFGKIKSSEITIFSRQLASLIRAGVPILRALWIIGEQSPNAKFKQFLTAAQDEIRNGKTFSSVLSQYPKLFPPIYIAMIRTGEDSGTLQETLLRIADYRQKQEEIVSKVRAAMAYPALMALTGVGTVVYMLTFVIPRLTTLFSRMGGQLPLPTKILMTLSGFFQKPLYWGIFSVLIFLAIIVGRFKKEKLKDLWGHLSLRLFFIKDMVMKTELARFSRTLELLIKCGVPILRALEITAPVINNIVLKKQIEKSHEEVAGGKSLGASLRESNRFPLFLTNLISVGEESGHMDEALGEIALFYERETDEAIKIMTSLLEPLMILVMGLVVGFIVIAMMLPMFELNMMVN